MIDDKVYKGIPGQYLKIEKKWKPGEKIKIHFDIPAIIIPGGKSYPDRIAIQRGPQVLAIDQSMNQFIQPDSLGIRISGTTSFSLHNVVKSLPENWIGKQAYAMIAENYQGHSKDIILVPFSDAGQTGENVTVWIKGVRYR
jgi:DUF1680 family protein